jgi:hypothetical protein
MLPYRNPTIPRLPRERQVPTEARIHATAWTVHPRLPGDNRIGSLFDRYYGYLLRRSAVIVDYGDLGRRYADDRRARWLGVEMQIEVLDAFG